MMPTSKTHACPRRGSRLGRLGSHRLNGILAMALLASSLSISSPAGPAVAGAGADQPDIEHSLAEARRDLQLAKDLGAKKYLPTGFEEVEAGLTEVEELLAAGKGNTQSVKYQARDLSVKARRLRVQAEFVHDMREQKYPWEITLRRFDQSLREMALTTGLTFPADLSGPAAADVLLDSLGNWKLSQQMLTDSLRVANRRYERKYEVMAAEQESTVTALKVELSTLRRQLWDTELRAGMAEAERSAAELDLNQRREREQVIQEITDEFGPQEGEVLLTPNGDVIIRVFGFSFAVGSVELQGGQEPLVEKLVAAVAKFPGTRIRVEGHTDDTGGHDVNLRLSRRRAETVADLLAGRLELAPDKVEIVGYGPDRPVATNSTAEGRGRNRRIDIVILAGGS